MTALPIALQPFPHTLGIAMPDVTDCQWTIDHLASVRRRGAMHFGAPQDGAATAYLLRMTALALLRWRPGAHLQARVAGVEIDLRCRWSAAGTEPARPRYRPLHVPADGLAVAGQYDTLMWLPLGCARMEWELRDQAGALHVRQAHGRFLHAVRAAPDLPRELCLRVRLRIGDDHLPAVPATLRQLAHACDGSGRPESDAACFGTIAFVDAASGAADFAPVVGVWWGWR